ncbi:MAG: lytic murein transglycosylase B [Gammaproteobacteria bacterium]|nr:lytic murein transglycosylase B [Gammaproteobacteria bacterium]NNC66433.1 lytic murein transglycosylase B [Gammaproteobacteria bacterium]
MYKYSFLLTALFFSCGTQSFANNDYLSRVEVQKFIDEFSVKNKYSKESLDILFKKVTRQTQVLEAIQRPAEKEKNWEEYQKIFITDKRIKEGMAFWTENASILAAAEREYGVPPEIVVAIVGVETFYGRYKGKYPVLDSLVTLGFDYPPRQKFFRSELAEFLLLAQEENLDPLAIKGSYAGAMGKSQFISSSYRRYAVDFDENGRRDLWESNEDVIGSVANYFKRHGWKANEIITVPAKVQGKRYKALLEKGLKPVASISELPQYDVDAEHNADAKQAVALLEFKNNDSDEYWLGFNNFYVITRYNHSHMYAMAVYQLSQQIKQDIKDYVVQN